MFKLDIAITLEDCHRLYPDWDDLPEECQLIIANMMFNLDTRSSKFKGMKAGVDARSSIPQPTDGRFRWYTQVPNRARRLVTRMRALADEE